MNKKIVLHLLLVVLAVVFSGCRLRASEPSLASSTHGTASVESTGLVSNDGNSKDTSSGEDFTPPTEPPSTGKTFEYGPEIDATLNTFVEWIKHGETKNVFGSGFNKYSYNRPFIDWASGSDEILLPTIKNDNYKLHHMRIVADECAYNVIYDAGDDYELSIERTMNIVVRPLNEAEAKMSFEEYFIKYHGTYYTEHKEDYKKVAKPFKWGNYAIDEYWCNPSLGTAYIKIGNYQIGISFYRGYQDYAKWDEKYFDYLDFEMVSLK